ncbi:MAG: hypothetical protein OH338_05085 [Candidatus Parvarchaeota archaeon]|nr:hypothetical protein [Candidatus Parvarchaeum tengchongense]
MERKEIRLSKKDIKNLEKLEKKEEKLPEISITPDMVEVLMKAREISPKEETKLEDVYGTEEATAKCLVELIKPDKINLLTDLTFEEIQALTVAEVFGQFILEKTNSTLILDLCQSYKELKVSLGRRGRTEIVDLATFVTPMAELRKSKLPSLIPFR